MCPLTVNARETQLALLDSLIIADVYAHAVRVWFATADVSAHC